MKLQYATSKIETSGALDHRRASIDLNPTLAHVLSKDLYQNEVESPFREVLINSLDSHVEAGTDRPVEIYLPSMWDELFYIRDYGTGLSHDRFMEIYLAYGLSTRRESNEVHGGLGLGTKSPLAYTSSFTVVSYFQGVARTYVIYHDSDNLPCVDHINEERTDELPGLKVQYTTVSGSDWSQFVVAAENLLKRIPKDKYTIVGCSSIVNSSTMLNLDPVSNYQDYGVVRLLKGKGNLSVVMGYVAYKFDVEAVLSYMRSKNLELTIGATHLSAATVLTQLIKRTDIEIMSTIGEYPVHPSRERINVTPRSVNLLCVALQGFLDATFSSKETNFEEDIRRFQLAGVVAPEVAELRIRARHILPGSYYREILIPPTLRTYGDLVASVSRSEKSVQVAFLSPTDFTDYLGNGRARYTFPPAFPSDTSLLFIDIATSAVDPAIFSSLIEYNPTEDMARFLREQEQNKARRGVHAPIRSFRAPVKSFQEPEHNILVLRPGCSGSRKADWASAKHNVASLKALNKEIFWVPTKMGCISDYRDVVNEYMRMLNAIPNWKQVTIIGLPATKGTTTIEKAFKPVKELSTWLIDFIASDYMQRRIKLEALASLASFNPSRLEIIEGYGKASWLLRLIRLSHKYNKHSVNVLTKLEGTPEYIKVESFLRDIETKFSILTTPYYSAHTGNSDLLRNWAKELADLQNCHPTGIKSRYL